MADEEHLDRLEQGVDDWNTWRLQFPNIRPNLIRADLSERDLSEANLSGVQLNEAHLGNTNLMGTDLSDAELESAYLYEANLQVANLKRANLIYANLSGANLRGANLTEAFLANADLAQADLHRATLKKAHLDFANLSYADLSRANLQGADPSGATFIRTDLTDAILSNCRVYGVSVWQVTLQRTKQENLIITPEDETAITVDTLEVAQFIYLLLSNPKIRDVLDTIARKAVLILGRFTPERKAILELLKNELRNRGYVPILFDFKKPDSKDLTETVSILAHLSRFVLIDLTDPNCSPYEVATIANNCITPLQPLILDSQHEFPMLADLQKRYHWVLPIYHYKNADDLRVSLDEKIIAAVEQKAQELIQPHRTKEVT